MKNMLKKYQTELKNLKIIYKNRRFKCAKV